MRSVGGTVEQFLAISIGGRLPDFLVRMGAVKRAFPLRLVLGTSALAAYPVWHHVIARADASSVVSWPDVNLNAGQLVGCASGFASDGAVDSILLAVICGALPALGSGL